MPNPDDTQKRKLPPYLPYATFKNFRSAMKETGLPSQIDKSVLGKYSGATQSTLLLTLKFLKLIDEKGLPSTTLASLVEGPEQNQPRTLHSIIENAYDFVAAKKIDLASATQKQLEDCFEDQGLSGETTRKAVSFYVLLATEAGIKVSAHLKSAKRKLATRKAKKRSDEETPANKGGTPAVTPPPEAPGHKTYTLDLAVDGTRIVRVTAPTDLKSEEIERLSGWLHFQFNVAWKKP